MNKKKWLTLSLVGTALLLIPRRSSRQTPPTTESSLKGPHNDAQPLATDKNRTQITAPTENTTD
jgi:hypothetical protein